MATAGNGMASSESGGAGEKFCKMPFQPENATGMSSDQGGNSAATGTQELEQILKQVTITGFKIQHITTIEDLPDEILSNIFIRLSAKQLGQMRSVSKYWNTLLSHPSFVKSHLQCSIRNNNEQVLLVFHYFYEEFTQYSCNSTHLKPIYFIQKAPIIFPMNPIGSVNGLICVSDNSFSKIHIWNPSLSAMSAIPPPHSLSGMSIITPPHHYMSTSMRFGFDPKTNDYKLVKIQSVCVDNRDGDRVVKEWLKVEVYSMRKGSWEFITQPVPSHITRLFDTDCVCVDGHDGHLHWQNETGPLTKHTILAFDLGSVTFCEIPLPDSILNSNHKSHDLGVLGGKLCEISWREDGAWEVWVMEEYGVPESWVIRHVYSQFNEEVRLYGFTLRNELLLKDEDGCLVLFNPNADKTKSTRRVEYICNIVEYVDSLVWI